MQSLCPILRHALLESLEVLKNAVESFEEKCIRGIRAHPDRCREYAERSVGQAARLNEQLGFMGAAEVAQQAIETGKSIATLMHERSQT